MQIVHHSTQALPDLVNDVYSAHRPPPVPTASAEAVFNGGTLGKQPMSKPSIEVWILQVCIPRLLHAPCVRVTARQEHDAD